jgi:hypothetical protein
MKSSWYATLMIAASLVAGALVSQSFGGDKGSSRGGRASGGPSVARKVSGGSTPKFNGGSLSSGIAGKIGGSQPAGGTFKPRVPTVPISGPINSGKKVPMLPGGPIVTPKLPKLPGNPIVNPTLPKLPGGPIVTPKLPKLPGGPIVKPIIPIKPFPICPKLPICPPHYPGGHCGPWYPLPGWWGCHHHHCPPICITLPAYCGYPCVITETIIVEGATEPVLINAQVVENVADAKLMQVPVGATLTLADKNLGADEGQVVLEVEAVSLPAKVNEWKADQVNMTLPMFGLGAPTKAKIWLVRKDGQVANTLMVELIPATPESQQAAAGATAQASAQK